jgi:ATPase subunit of ABC transporter with duplicated ATPase domains
MGHIELSRVSYELPDGRVLLDDVSFRVGDGTVAALVGASGAGKTALLRIIAGELSPHRGTVTRSGSLALMPQFVGGIRDDRTVRDLLIETCPQPLTLSFHAAWVAERRG